MPPAPRLELPKPEPKDLADLDAKLAALTSENASERDDAVRSLLEVDARLVPALAFRLDAIAERADKEAMKRLFAELRKESSELDRAESDDTARAAGSTRLLDDAGPAGAARKEAVPRPGQRDRHQPHAVRHR
ncbi:MAG: hypothetical protein QM756_20225 [Polyangiaceae bacterium]